MSKRSTSLAYGWPVDWLPCCRYLFATPGYCMVWLILGDPSKVQIHPFIYAHVSASYQLCGCFDYFTLETKMKLNTQPGQEKDKWYRTREISHTSSIRLCKDCMSPLVGLLHGHSIWNDSTTISPGLVAMIVTKPRF
jgi:hypothetical protein